MEKIRRFVRIEDLADVIGSEITLESVKVDVPSTADLEEEYHSDDSGESSIPDSSKPSPTGSSDSRLDGDDDEPLSLTSYSTIGDVIPEGIDWPTPALIRFFHLITANGLPNQELFEHIFLHDVYIHEDDLERYQNVMQASDSSPIEYFKPNYDIDSSLTCIRLVIEKFYNITPIQGGDDDEFGDYSYSPLPLTTPEPERTTPAPLSRSRRTGRANPLVKSILDDKKQHSRKSSNA